MVDISQLGATQLGGLDHGDDDDTGVNQAGYIHIRNQQRNGRKSITNIQGIPDKFNHKKILKAFKKMFNCNGSVVEDDDFGCVIQLQGDKRAEVSEFLHFEGIADKEQIKVHGV